MRAYSRRSKMSNIPSGSSANPDVEHFQQLADGAPVMIWMSGTDMGCFYFNRAWLDFRGRTLADEFGNGWAEGVHPDDLERCVQHYASSFQRRAAFAMSYRLQHHTGEFRWILDRGAPHWAADGQFLGFFGGCAETPAADRCSTSPPASARRSRRRAPSTPPRIGGCRSPSRHRPPRWRAATRRGPPAAATSSWCRRRRSTRRRESAPTGRGSTSARRKARP